MEYIYLLREREFIKTGEPVYKLGKTKQPNLARFSRYPKGSEILLQTACTDCDTAEKELLRLYKNKFTQRSDIGSEYFAGDPREMIGMIHQYFTPPHTAIQEQVAITTSNKPANNSAKYIPKRNTNGDYTYIIDTYEKFTRVAATVSKIVITNKEKLTGWMLTKGGVWKRLKKYTAKTSNNKEKYYTLLGLIEQAYKDSVSCELATPEEKSEFVCDQILINWQTQKYRIHGSAYLNNAAATGYEIIGVVHHYRSRQIHTHAGVLWDLDELDENIRPDPTAPVNFEGQYAWIPFTVDKNVLLRDILEKCYNPNPTFDNLDYHMLVIGATSKYEIGYNNDGSEAVVTLPMYMEDAYSYDLDLRNLTVRRHYKSNFDTSLPLDDVYADDLLERKSCSRIVYTGTIVGRSGPNKFPHDVIHPKNIVDAREIVSNILANYVESRESLNNFRRFMYNILICSKESRLVLQDPTGIYATICTGVVRGLNNEYLIRFYDSTWEDEECFNYFKYERKMKKYGTRAICVSDKEPIVQDMARLYSITGIRYVVVITAKDAIVSSDGVRTYDEASKAGYYRANNYFKTIQGKIIEIINTQVGCINTWNNDPSGINIGDLFTRTDRMLYNFVQWCGGAYDE